MNDLDTLKRNAGINEDQQTMKVKVVNSGYKTDMGIKDAVILGQELDMNMKPILKLRIKDINLGDPVYADFRNGEWIVDMD